MDGIVIFLDLILRFGYYTKSYVFKYFLNHANKEVICEKNCIYLFFGFCVYDGMYSGITKQIKPVLSKLDRDKRCA